MCLCKIHILDENIRDQNKTREEWRKTKSINEWSMKVQEQDFEKNIFTLQQGFGIVRTNIAGIKKVKNMLDGEQDDPVKAALSFIKNIGSELEAIKQQSRHE